MRLTFDVPQDGQVHQYCWGCHAEAVTWVRVDGRSRYDCAACGQRHERSVVVDPAVRWWLGPDHEYWHESAGVFVRRDGRFLFFERIDFPPRWTVPSGHVDTGELPDAAAARELKEEVGLVAPTALVHVGTEDIVGDSCRRGADAHRWHAYLADLPDAGDVEVLDEGHRPVWLTLAEAVERNLSVPVRHMLTRYGAGPVLSGAARTR